jgi:hypothetical protein
MSELDDKLNDFISHSTKSKVAVIVPLFGYWKDIKDNPLNLQTLKISIDRLKSSVHQVYIFFVAEPGRMPTDIQNYIIVQSKAGGNVSGVHIDTGASYADYIRKGLEAAVDTTEAAYFVVFSPWNLIQRVGLDMMVDRINYGDEAKIISGYNLVHEVSSDNFNPDEFEALNFNLPIEKYKVDLNFMGITRQFLELIPLDPEIKTSSYFEADIFQNMHAKGFAAVSSQRIPMFVFDVTLGNFENPADLEADKLYFSKKWGFLPTI